MSLKLDLICFALVIVAIFVFALYKRFICPDKGTRVSEGFSTASPGREVNSPPKEEPSIVKKVVNKVKKIKEDIKKPSSQIIEQTPTSVPDDKILFEEPYKKKIWKHQEECRRIFEKLFNRDFVQIRPDWLKNPITGYNLEVDGYCEDIVTPIGRGIGFEYDGGQHDRFTKKYHRSVNDFIYTVKKDSWKDQQFKKLRKVLVRIPSSVRFCDLEKFIRMRLRDEKIVVN